jgi:hypothetical protein
VATKANQPDECSARIFHASADLAAFKAYDLSAARSLVENANVKVFMRTDEPTAPKAVGDDDE